MKKNLFLVCVLFSLIASAQVKIGNNPKSLGTSSILEIEYTSKALLITRVSDTTAIAQPVNGMIIYDLSTNCFRGYANGVWTQVFNDQAITLDCASATITGTLQSGVAASGVSATVPYTGGNGSTHGGQIVASTGVLGLTAALAPGTFAVGAGSLTYTITGTPASAGTALFALDIGGGSCNLEITVDPL